MEEIRQLEMRRRQRDEMEAMSKFIMLDMINDNCRETITESYFEIEALEQERKQLMLEQ